MDSVEFLPGRYTVIMCLFTSQSIKIEKLDIFFIGRMMRWIEEYIIIYNNYNYGRAIKGVLRSSFIVRVRVLVAIDTLHNKFRHFPILIIVPSTNMKLFTIYFLFRYLQACRECSSPLSTRQLVDFGLQVARGLSHLHQMGILHRDIATRNCV